MIKNIIEQTDETILEYMFAFFLKNISDTACVYHYTNCDGLISIIENNEIWLSNVAFMNDKQEIDNSLNIIKESIKKTSVPEQLKNDFIKEFIKTKMSSTRNIGASPF